MKFYYIIQIAYINIENQEKAGWNKINIRQGALSILKKLSV